jgi:hypothetical protein
MNRRRLFWCNVPFACFGFETFDDVVVQAAPIAKWMIGQTLRQIRPWCVRKRAKVREVQIDPA